MDGKKFVHKSYQFPPTSNLPESIFAITSDSRVMTYNELKSTQSGLNHQKISIFILAF